MPRAIRGNGREQFADEDDGEDDIQIIAAETGKPVDDEVSDPEVIKTDPKTVEPPEDDALAVLQRNYDALQAERTQERARVRELEAERGASEADTIATQRALLVAGESSAKQELAGAKQALAAARASGDVEAEANALELIAEKKFEALRYGEAKDDFERAVKAKRSDDKGLKEAERKPVAPAGTPEAEIDKFIGTLTPATQAWAKKNRAHLFGDAKNTQQAFALHDVALAAGIVADTPEYFSYMNARMGYADEQPTVTKTTPAARTTTQRRPPPVASAPVKRGTVSPAVSVSLTQEQRDMAAKLGMSLARYGRHLAKAEAGGKDPNYSGPRLSKHDPALSGRR